MAEYSGSGPKPLIRYNEFPFGFFIIALFLRAVDLVFVKSWFVPDEYWQSLEVAHKLAFGYGLLTWEWSEGARSYLYVGLFTALYKVLAYFEIDTQEAVIIAPRIIQGIISALGDVYFLRWVAERRNGQYSWAAISWITCTFISYCSTRTLINTLEMNLTVIALYYYPWTPKTNSTVFALLVSLSFFIRPTAIITWFPLILINIATVRYPIIHILKKYLPFFLLMGAISIGFDSWMHGSYIFTAWNFFRFNVLKNIGQFYGSHNFFWYFYCGIPVVLGLQFVPFIIGIYRASFSLKNWGYKLEAQLFISIVCTVFLYSLSPHKEFRFLLPILPMMIYLSSGVLSRWSVDAKAGYIYAVGTALIVIHIFALIFLGQFHKTGPLETMRYLGKESKNLPQADILFLAPCHSFPGYSHLHSNVSVRHLQCKPNFDQVPNYSDEADTFYNDTRAWLVKEYTPVRSCILPTHVIKFSTLNLTNFLHFNNYTLVKQIHNFIPYYFEDRLGDHVQVYKRRGPKC